MILGCQLSQKVEQGSHRHMIKPVNRGSAHKYVFGGKPFKLIKPLLGTTKKRLNEV